MKDKLKIQKPTIPWIQNVIDKPNGKAINLDSKVADYM